MSKIYLAITIDTECDKGKGWKVKQPLSFKNTREGVINNLQPIFNNYGVRATYLLSPEVMRDDKSVEVFKSLLTKVELGTHLHAEFIEPEANFESDNTDAYQKDYSSDIERQKLKNLTRLFKDTFGYQPTSFRAGRFGISAATLTILEDLGYDVDSSVTPDMFWKNKNVVGNTLNFYGSPYQPYYPDKNDYREEGEMRILQVPVSVLNYKLSSLPNWLKRGIRQGKKYQRIAFSYLTNFSKASWLRPTFSSLEEMQKLTYKYVRLNKGRDVYLCMMFHSNEFEVGTSPYSLNSDDLSKIAKRLDSYLDWLRKEFECEFVGLSDFKKKLA